MEKSKVARDEDETAVKRYQTNMDKFYQRGIPKAEEKGGGNG
jgi:hypothetical protein